MESTVLPISQSRTLWRTLLPTVTILVFLLMGLGYATFHVARQEYNNSTKELRNEMERSNQAAAEHAHWIIQASQQVLLRIDQTIGDLDSFATWNVTDLVALSSGLPAGSQIFITDKEGVNLQEWPIGAAEVNVQNTEYFRTLAAGNVSTYISRQFFNDRKNTLVFIVARRLERNGKFSGIAAIAIPVEWFRRFYKNFDLGEKTRIWLTTNEGWLVASYPPIDGTATIADFPLWNEMRENFSIYLVSPKTEKDEAYYLASRHLNTVPLVSTIVISKEEHDAKIRRRIAVIVFTGSGGGLALITLAFSAIWRWRARYFRQQELEMSLAENLQVTTNLKLALQAGSLGYWYMDPPDWKITLNDNLTAFLELPPDQTQLTLRQICRFVWKEDRLRVFRRIKQTIHRGRNFKSEFRLIRQDGSIGWVAGSGILLKDSDGRPIRITGVSQDITERHRSDERQSLMIAELNHRVKNTLATVQSMARRGLDRGEKTEAFIGRLAALAHAHSLLSESKWRGSSMKSLLTRHLDAYVKNEDNRIFLEGPDLLLRPRTTQGLSLVLHELTTNAAKYGALNAENGNLSIHWSIIRSAGRQRLRLEWTETGCTDLAPVSHEGFGSKLVRQSIVNELSGSYESEFAPNGFRCQMEFPLSAREITPAQNMTPTQVEKTSLPVNNSDDHSRILLVEDSALVALDMQARLEEFGFIVVGPRYELATAISSAKNDMFDLALLDVNLDGDLVFPLAEILSKRGIPFIFLSGYGNDANWPKKWAGIPRLTKPVQDSELKDILYKFSQKKHAFY